MHQGEYISYLLLRTGMGSNNLGSKENLGGWVKDGPSQWQWSRLRRYQSNDEEYSKLGSKVRADEEECSKSEIGSDDLSLEDLSEGSQVSGKTQ
jgi:hypothetical protein